MVRSLPGLLVVLCGLIFSSCALAGDAYWIDVRSAEEYQADHVAIAAHIPYDELADRIGEVTEDRGAEIYLYCRSGRRAGIALKELEAMGYTGVVNLDTLENARRKAAGLTER